MLRNCVIISEDVWSLSPLETIGDVGPTASATSGKMSGAVADGCLEASPSMVVLLVEASAGPVQTTCAEEVLVISSNLSHMLPSWGSCSPGEP